jgi:hypothetical protein
MIQAGRSELRERCFAEDWGEVAKAVYLAMEAELRS